METSEKIISTIETKYPPTSLLAINNGSDLEIEQRVGYVTQYFFGLATSDPIGDGSYEIYKDKIRKKLKGVAGKIDFLIWAFYKDDLDEVKQTLSDLDVHFKAKLDINKMIAKLNTKDRQQYGLVITIITTTIVHA